MTQAAEKIAPEQGARSVIAVPPLLVAVFDQLVDDYAKCYDERPEDVRRALEIGVLQRGIRSVQEELRANKEFAFKMGWTGP